MEASLSEEPKGFLEVGITSDSGFCSSSSQFHIVQERICISPLEVSKSKRKLDSPDLPEAEVSIRGPLGNLLRARRL